VEERSERGLQIIDIKVSGEKGRRRDFLLVIRNEILTIHKKALDDEMKDVSSEYLDEFREDMDLYADIRKYLPKLTNILRDMNVLTAKIHTETGFDELIHAIERKIAE
jgi:hypothetical protein